MNKKKFVQVNLNVCVDIDKHCHPIKRWEKHYILPERVLDYKNYEINVQGLGRTETNLTDDEITALISTDTPHACGLRTAVEAIKKAVFVGGAPYTLDYILEQQGDKYIGIPPALLKTLFEALSAHPPADKPEWDKKIQSCGCILCTCEDTKQCQGCGAKSCGTDHCVMNAHCKPAPDASACKGDTRFKCGNCGLDAVNPDTERCEECDTAHPGLDRGTEQFIANTIKEAEEIITAKGDDLADAVEKHLSHSRNGWIEYPVDSLQSALDKYRKEGQ